MKFAAIVMICGAIVFLSECGGAGATAFRSLAGQGARTATSQGIRSGARAVPAAVRPAAQSGKSSGFWTKVGPDVIQHGLPNLPTGSREEDKKKSR